MITTEQIKNLRAKTSVSVIQCKKALEEADGDEKKALEILKQKSKEIAVKKSDRELGAGTVAAYIHAGGSIGAMIELLCETDFVANNEEFKELARQLAMHAVASKPEFVRLSEVPEDKLSEVKQIFADDPELKDKDQSVKEKIIAGKTDAHLASLVLEEQPYIKDNNVKVSDLTKQYVQKFGEKIEIGRLALFSVDQ